MEMTSDRNFLNVNTRVTASDEHSEVKVKTDVAQMYWETAFMRRKIQRRGNPKAMARGVDFEKSSAWYVMSEYMIKNPGKGRACYTRTFDQRLKEEKSIN